MFNVGDKIKILRMSGEPDYTNKIGVITHIGQDFDKEVYYRGTWGGLSVYPSQDIIEKI